MVVAEEIRPGDVLVTAGVEGYDVVYVVESTRINRGERLTYSGMHGVEVEEKGSVSILVRFAADGGTDIRRFSLGQETPLFHAADVDLP